MKKYFYQTITFKIEVETDPIPPEEVNEDGANCTTWRAHLYLSQENWVYKEVIEQLKRGKGKLDREEIAALVITGLKNPKTSHIEPHILGLEETIYVDEICKEWERTWGEHLK